MVKFYTCFPISMDGNQLSISMAPEHVDLKDEVNNRTLKPSFSLDFTKFLRSNLLFLLSSLFGARSQCF